MPGDTTLEASQYRLDIAPGHIDITGGDYSGVACGIATLRQLLPAASGSIEVPCLRITDKPRYGWRGLLLDSSRHFWSVDEVKRLLDLMACYKLNRLHWHLVDDEGWRIEIKRYPQLTGQGAFRPFDSHDLGCEERAVREHNADLRVDRAKMKVDEHGDSHRYRGLGLLNEIFNNGQVGKLQGSLGIGCVKYANASRGGLDNVGPFFFRHHSGDFCVASDGNLVNSKQIAEYLEKRGTIFQTDTDAELLAHLIKKSASEDRIVNIVKALNMMEGGYTFVIMTKNRIYAARDKYGIKPLCIGKIGDGYVVSSESCAFGIMGAEFIRDVRPGEIISLDHHGIRSTIFSKFCKHRMCGMEYIYFARPDSDIDGCNVHAYRKEAGRRLYRE